MSKGKVIISFILMNLFKFLEKKCKQLTQIVKNIFLIKKNSVWKSLECKINNLLVYLGYIWILKFRNPNPLPHTKFLPLITCYTSNQNNIEIIIYRLFKLWRFIATIDFTSTNIFPLEVITLKKCISFLAHSIMSFQLSSTKITLTKLTKF